MSRPGIAPSPLYNEILQPRDPPESATPQVLGLFERLLIRRSAQLNLLPLQNLQSAFTLLEGSALLTKYISKLFKDLPDKKPKTKLDFVSIIKYLICENFYQSVDTKYKGQTRKGALSRFQEVLRILDVVYTDYTDCIGEDPIQKKIFEEKRRAELEREKAQREREKIAQEEAQKKLEKERKEKEIQNRVIEELRGAQAAAKQREEEAKKQKQLEAKQREEEAKKQKQLEAKQREEEAKKQKQLEAKQREEEAKKQKQLEAKQVAAVSTITKGGTMGGVFSQKKNDYKYDDDDSSIEILGDEPASSNENEITPVPSNVKPVAVKENVNESASKDNEKQQSDSTNTILSINKFAMQGAMAKINSPSTSSMKTKPPKFPQNELSLFRHRPIAVTIQPDLQQGTSSFTSSASLAKYARKNFAKVSMNHTEVNINSHDFDCRLEKWEPFWSVSEDLTKLRAGDSEAGQQTTPVKGSPDIKSVWTFSGRVQENHTKISWLRAVAGTPSNGEQRLILRCLPFKIKEEYKKLRADTHLWPKGTLVEVNGRLVPIQQRKQQSHDEALWKGLSSPLDITSLLSGTSPFNITISTKDTDLYAIQLAVCKYISPNALFQRCMAPGDRRSIQKLSFEEGLALWQKKLDEHQTVVLDESDDEAESDEKSDNKQTTCSLLCSVSKTAIQVPVRGKHCQHMQCFDLAVYLKTNEPISGPRWRCAICEDFVAVEDLVVDGYLSKILEEHREEISATRDKVRIHRDGTWKLLEDSEVKNSKKRNLSGSELMNGNKRARVENTIEIE
jgi:chemotaxis protein histidine kinase CheA